MPNRVAQADNDDDDCDDDSPGNITALRRHNGGDDGDDGSWVRRLGCRGRCFIPYRATFMLIFYIRKTCEKRYRRCK